MDTLAKYAGSVIFCLLIYNVMAAQFTLIPQQATREDETHTEFLDGVCSANTPGITSLNSIEIGRTSSGQKTSLVMIQSGDTTPTITDTSVQSRITVLGSIHGTEGSLQFSLRDPCSDPFDKYYCKTSYYTARGIGSDETTVGVKPSLALKMLVTPDMIMYEPPVLVKFTCSGVIGYQFPKNLANIWSWQWRGVNTPWTTYPYPANITYRTPTPSGSCSYKGGSTLTHTVTELDNGRQFRCSVVSDQYSANRTVYIKMSQNSHKSPTEVNGVAVGVTLTLVVFILLILVVILRRKPTSYCNRLRPLTDNLEARPLSLQETGSQRNALVSRGYCELQSTSRTIETQHI